LDVGERADPAFFARREHQAALAELEVQQHVERTAAFAHQVPSGDARVGRVVGNEFRDVLRSHEDRLELTAERGRERAFIDRVDGKARLAEQGANVVGKTTFIGQGNLQHLRCFIPPRALLTTPPHVGRSGIFSEPFPARL